MLITIVDKKNGKRLIKGMIQSLKLSNEKQGIESSFMCYKAVADRLQPVGWIQYLKRWYLVLQEFTHPVLRFCTSLRWVMLIQVPNEKKKKVADPFYKV